MLINTQTIKPHEDRVWTLAWNNNLLASCSGDKNICIFEYSDGKIIQKSLLKETHSKTIRSITWDHSGNYLASASFDTKINIWKRKNMEFECISTLEGQENEIKSVSFSVSGQYLASCSRDKTIYIWDAEYEDYNCSSILQSHTEDIKMVKWHPIEDILFSASYDNTIKMWRFDHSQDDWAVICDLKEHASTVWCIDFTPDGKYMVSVGDDMNVILWKIDGNKCSMVHKLNDIHFRSIYSCSINFTGNYLATVYIYKTGWM